MKTQSFFKPALMVIGCFAFAGCQKEAIAPSENTNSTQTMSIDKAIKPQTHQLKGEFTAGFYSFVPDMEAGYIAPNPAPGWYPGTATEGHLNLMGKCKSFVNMYASFGPSGLQGTAASLNLFFADQLSAVGITIPDAVAIICFDQQGNSIWARGVGTIPITSVDPTHVTFSGNNAEILGGTGKFAKASGNMSFSGYFNPQNTSEVGLAVTDGTIVY